ncbi:hypothetical protein EVAR_31017_1 [Eumeta japonica]|uniref:Uncharacterized protein n=1 Tax=Eumeta variegata TaxID=151549 RepID=A0A4C1VEI5_EUMVA|nr:hypothetical protein EVAR_31017_1 [Eumeta japonica]
MGYPCARTHGVCPTLTDQKPPETLRRKPLASSGIWSVKTTGALLRRRNHERARRADGRVAGAYHRDGRTSATARCTLRGTSHTHTRAEPDTAERGSKEH